MSERRTEEFYNPDELKRIYDGVEHGKARMAAIRSAIEAADANEDTPFRIYFRLILCEESNFYGDSMDMMVIFPEALAIADRYPDTPCTHFNDRVFKNCMGHVLWVYKWILNHCSSFYQIPMEDCMNFFEDYKRRCQAYGYNLQTYYKYLYNFYDMMGKEPEACEAFHAFERMSRDGNSDCIACDRNGIVGFYLDRDETERAAELAEDIENFKLRCHHDKMASWLRLKRIYMNYYLDHRQFEEAEKCCRMIERHMIEAVEYQEWDAFLYCYAHTNMGKALQIYKAHWKDWQEEWNPSDAFWTGLNVLRFFKKLGEDRKGKTVKLPLDATFPLYREDEQYVIEDLYQYYYDRSEKLAKLFDARNGTDRYRKKLELAK